MGGGHDFFSEEKTHMWCWLGENVKTAEIARHLGRHPGAVRNNSKNVQIYSKNMIY
jgi:IS30 family transposase